MNRILRHVTILAACAVSILALTNWANAQIVDNDWVGGNAGWFDSISNWSEGAFPGPNHGTKIQNGSTVTFDGSGQPGGTVEIESLRVGADSSTGDGTLNIVGGTLLLNGFEQDVVKLGASPGKTGIIVQTGGTVHALNGGFRIGAGRGDGCPGEAPVTGGTTCGEFGSYTISGGSMISDGPQDLGRMVVGETDGRGSLTVIGTGPVLIDSATRFEVESNATLTFVLDANGVTPIRAGVVGSTDEPKFRGPDAGGSLGPDPGAMLFIDFDALTTTIGDILLIENRTLDGIGSLAEEDAFINVAEGQVLHTFSDGSSYHLTYEFLGGTDGLDNDLGLIAVAPEFLPGDHNRDGVVDAADYVAWRKTNIDGQPGYDAWRANFGEMDGGPGGGATAVPEPNALALLLVAMLLSAPGLSMKRQTRHRSII